jgi:hypothetical protein
MACLIAPSLYRYSGRPRRLTGFLKFWTKSFAVLCAKPARAVYS